MSVILRDMIKLMKPISNSWHDYGKPTGGDVVSIIDAGNIRSGMVFTVR